MKLIKAIETKSERFPRMVNRETAMNAVMVALRHGEHAALDCYEWADGYIVSCGDDPAVLIDKDTARLLRDAYNEAERCLLFDPNATLIHLC